MRHAIYLIVLSLLVSGFTSCEKKLDAFQCILNTQSEDGFAGDPDEWIVFCVNPKTGEEKRIKIEALTQCIRTPENNCKWIMTDLNEYEIIRQQCKAKE